MDARRAIIDDPKHAESLRVAEQRTLEMIADGAGLEDTLNELCRAIDAQSSSVYSTILLMDPQAKHLWHAAGPRVPSGWIPRLRPRPIGPHEGCCGAAAYFRKRIIVEDVASDPVWSDDSRELAIENGIRAAWSEACMPRIPPAPFSGRCSSASAWWPRWARSTPSNC